MRFTSVISIVAALCGLAAAAPTSITRPDGVCPYGGNWDYCDWDGLYVVCVNGNPTRYTCDGRGCQPLCPGDQPCTPRCNNGRLA
ncbi:uncharacterized protein F4812DRAFT_399428 [Daldinia caldariorum]|uniref:uncharacterized protein n=1 Tax=Daldinia caldariorum TaxID=326644 RepID=UPI002007E4EA|nr:uncharacterized protein F4812DRAFT_399428 [Daldinia caldariorum]KAI1467500.1 hypothetical protein F4812DRAFT_399428 [Daldinia caldariorum]